ncbi:MAG: FAD-dependent thymidylate synthase [Helicobacteraceae bacterium]|nr:FAD-dependent thymidylate synthase [Helicobacteraceae bacterium]
MEVKLIHFTPLHIASTAIRKCWDSGDKSDTTETPIGKVCGVKDKELIYRVGNKFKHASTLEHLNYTFDIDSVSRALLQEVARHRHASISVKSTRYTLKELKEADDLSIFTIDSKYKSYDYQTLKHIQDELRLGGSNDQIKYMLPESYKTSYVWTINARSLQNFLALRTNKSALWEIRKLAYEVFNQLPEEHKYLFTEFLYKES